MKSAKISGFIKTLKSYSFTEIILTVVFAVVFVYAFLQIVFPPYSPFSSDVYIEGAVGRVVSLNPLFADLNDTERDITRLVFSGLTKYYPDTQDFRPELAEYTISDDGMLYTFNIKPDIFWHDGEKLTSQDIYYTFHDVIQSDDFQNSILKANFSKVQIEKKDNLTITFKLSELNTYFLSDLTVGILPYHILKNVPVKNIINSDFNKNPVGTGPYEFKSYKEVGDGATVTLKRFDDFYGKKSDIKIVKFLVFPNSNSISANLAEFNAVAKVTSEFIDDLRSNQSIKMVSYVLPQYTGLFFNTEDEILEKKEIRLALAKAIDINELAKAIPDRAAVNVGFFEIKTKSQFVRYDIAKAKQLLDEQDFKIRDKEDKYRKNKEGKELSVSLVLVKYPPKSYMETEMQKVADYIFKKWEEIGVKVEVDFLAQDEFNEAIKNSDYSATVVGESFGYNMDPFSFWYSTQAASNKNTSGGLNFSNYTNYSVDKLVEDMRNIFSKEKRASRTTQIIDYFREDIPVLFLYRPIYYYATDSKFFTGSMMNFVYSADRFWNISWWKAR
ncbi:hypothetical protein HZA39_00915 [Candidatus Peregrinibacteria bacterium]|nr:hypothetical protein [Candidatus Peregrinibacteria bacterium]